MKADLCVVVGCEQAGSFWVEVKGERAMLCAGHWEAANEGEILKLPEDRRRD